MNRKDYRGMILILHRPRGRRNEEKPYGERLHQEGSAKPSGSTLVGKGDPGGGKKPREILSWNALQERINHPREKCRDAAT